MRFRLSLPLALTAFLAVTALATGSPLFLLLAITLVLIILAEFLAVLWASATLRISAEISEGVVHRGEEATLVLRVRHQGYLPIAPVCLSLASLSGGETRDILLKNQPGRQQSLRMPLKASHVGVFSSGIRSCTVEGLLGFVRRRINTPDSLYSLTDLRNRPPGPRSRRSRQRYHVPGHRGPERPLRRPGLPARGPDEKNSLEAFSA